MKAWLPALLIGLALGALGMHLWHGPRQASVKVPDQWVARIGDDYISVDRFKAEMARRGGQQPGQFHSIEQKKALLQNLLYQRALVAKAEAEGLDQQAEVQSTIEQVLSNQVLRRDLRARQDKVEVSDAMVRAFYDANQASYALPERRRVAMIRIRVAADAAPAQWDVALAKLQAARDEAGKLDKAVQHFAEVAKNYSDDQASRYRGGVIGWIDTDAQQRYRFDPVVMDAAASLKAGEISQPLRGKDAVYLVRLVDLQEARTRPFEELADGIRQRLRQEGMKAIAESFRKELVSAAKPVVQDAVLAQIQPLSPPAAASQPAPPALPSKG